MQDHLSTQHTIRDARVEDVPELVALINALNRHEGTPQTMTVAHAEFILFHPQRKVRMRCRVAVSRGRLLGFILFYEGYDTASTSMGFHIADVFVSHDVRRQSIGRALVVDVAALCLDSGGEWCSLTAMAQNASAAAFYDALGFVAPEVAFRCIGPKGLRILVDESK